MLLRRLALPLLLTACGPKDAGNTVGASDTSSSDSTGDGLSTTGGPSTGTDDDPTTAPGPVTTSGAESVPTTTADPDGTTSPTAATTLETSTTVPGTTTSGGDELPDPSLDDLVVFVLATEGGGVGLDGVARFEPDPALVCPDQPPPECPGGPELGAPKLLVDGVFAGPDAVVDGSRVAALFPFDQPDCALGCGGFDLSVLLLGGDGFAGTGSLPLDLPCSTETSKVWLAVDFGTVHGKGNDKFMTTLRIGDPCFNQSATRFISFIPE